MRIGILSRLLAPWRGGCGKCDTSWLLVTPHETRIGGEDHGPLCERCWAELSHEERLPYYYPAYTELMRKHDGITAWLMVEAAVYAEPPAPAGRPAPWRRAAAAVRAAAARLEGGR